MKIFVYEFVMGGGLLIDPSLRPVAHGLAVEGFSMLRSIVEDFAAADCGVSVLRDITAWQLVDATLEPHVEFVDVTSAAQAERSIIEQSRSADWTIVIAPEINGQLLRIVRRLEEIGSRLLSPNSAFVEIAADKLRTCETLQLKCCPTIESHAFDEVLARELLQSESALVLKPRFGAGSSEIRIVRNRDDLKDVALDNDGHFLMQPFVNGTAVSVSAICNGKTASMLPACYQHFNRDGESPFEYLGGRLPIAKDLQQRAWRLATRAVEALPATIGMCGVDLILDDEISGSKDFVVEINPRLTTSYIGLREATNDNLASAMLAAATGRNIEVSFSDSDVAFSCSEVTGTAANNKSKS